MASSAGGLVPAQLGFLAIYNPSLGTSDDTIDDQIVYYSSVSTQNTASPSSRKRRNRSGRPTADISDDERNERLRQIGLAQGMIDFSRGFANGSPVDTIDTEKARILTREVEPGWWLLASIEFTKVPLPPRLATRSSDNPQEQYEYSSKEMKPSSLLLRDLLRAHGTFLLHHDSSLSALFVRSRRSKSVAVLSRYWDFFLSTWNVMLHGNPARTIYGAINIAASGELGVGVGEEERGSGEREVLEGLVGRVEGLVDCVVSKFGDAAEDDGILEDQKLWLGTGQEPGPEDGAIFLGTGALSRKSLRDITHWMEDLYTWGEQAYGVIESPTSTRRKAKSSKAKSENNTTAPTKQVPEDVPQPQSTEREPTKHEQSKAVDATEARPDTQAGAAGDEEGKLDKMVSYLKLGYGSYWTLPGGSAKQEEGPGEVSTTATQELPTSSDSRSKIEPRPTMPDRTISSEAAGHYLIGLKGEIEEANSDHYFSGDSADLDATRNSRTVLRTVNVELETESEGRPEATIVKDFEHPGSVLTQSQVVGSMIPGYESHDLNKAKKLRVVVYVNKPFMFAFLFQLRTDSLAWDTLYRSLHYQLAPLKKPLLVSTSYRPPRPHTDQAGSNLYDLVWDSSARTLQSTIPNIPEFYTPEDSWTRADALNTHLHMLNIYAATRPNSTEAERTSKTNRGWWIVWTRVEETSQPQQGGGGGTSSYNPVSGTASPYSPPIRPSLATIRESPSAAALAPGKQPAKRSDSDDSGKDVSQGSEREEAFLAEQRGRKEIFLIRRASDHVRFRSMGSYGSDANGSESAGKLMQGIGVDTRRYVEELLTLL